MKINTYAVNCNDAWLNTEGDDISGSCVKYKDYQEVVAALEDKCAAMAAENAAQRHLLDMIAETGNANIGRTLFPTPATDAFLAEVRAQGVEMYADNIDNVAGDAERGGFDYAVKFLRSEASSVRLFAAQVRKGASSAKIHGSDTATDNTNQQFESLRRGDK